MKDNDKKFKSAVTYLPNYHYDRLERVSRKLFLPKSMLISLIVDKELEKEVLPDYSIRLLEDNYDEFTFADEGSKILTYMTYFKKPQGLDYLYLLRRDMGIPDGETFLNAFKECLKAQLIEPVVAKKGSFRKLDFASDYMQYQLTGKVKVKTVKRRGKEYEEWLRLKEKYGDE